MKRIEVFPSPALPEPVERLCAIVADRAELAGYIAWSIDGPLDPNHASPQYQMRLFRRSPLTQQVGVTSVWMSDQLVADHDHHPFERQRLAAAIIELVNKTFDKAVEAQRRELIGESPKHDIEH